MYCKLLFTCVITFSQSNQAKRKFEEENIFDALETFKGVKFPNCVKSFLQDAAYDSKPSLMLLDIQQVAEIETHLADNGADIIASLDCCNSVSYRNQKHFRFLPGHRSLILSIPDEIREMDTVAKKKRRLMMEFKKLLTSSELKCLLLTRLNQNAVKFGFECDSWTSSKLNDVMTIIINNQLTGKCSVQCFLCNVTIGTLYKGFWNTSNIMRHIKTHCSSGGINELTDNNALAYTDSSSSPKKNDFNPKATSNPNGVDSDILEKLKSGEINYLRLNEIKSCVNVCMCILPNRRLWSKRLDRRRGIRG